MKLEKYLADYIEQEKFVFASTYVEMGGDVEVEISIGDLQEIIKQGLNAFESTENTNIIITEHTPAVIVRWFDMVCRGIRAEYEDGASERDLIIDKNTLLELLEVE